MLSISFISVGLVSLSALFLGLITYLNNPKNISNKIFGLLCVASASYTSFNFIADIDQQNALIWTRTTFAAAVLVILFMFLFISNFPRKVLGYHNQISAAVIGGLLLVMSYTPFIVEAVKLKQDKTDVIIGPWYLLFIIYVVISLISMSILIHRTYRQAGPLDRQRINYVLGGFFITVLLISITNIILPLLAGNNDLSTYGSYFVLIFIIFCSLAIVRTRLFNLRLVVARSITYILLLISLGLVYGLLFFVTTQLFVNDFGTKTSESFLSTVLALILAFTFQPLRGIFERVTDRIFYRDRYDSQQVLNQFSGILVSELNLDRILRRTLADICTQLRIQFGQVIVYNNDRIYRIEHHGPLPKRLMVAPELKRLNHAILVTDELSDGEQKQILTEHGIRVSLTLRTREEFIGHLLLGDKLSGDIYSSQDIEILEILSKQLAVAVQNAKAYAEIQEFNQTLQARVDHATSRLRVANRHLKELDKTKDEFISMASHQLRTPLTTIKGYLSMMLEGDAGKMSKTQSEFAGYAFGSSERMVNLISDLLNVSRLSAGRFIIQTKPTDMVGMIRDEVRQLENHAKAKHLKLIFDEPKEALPLAEIDDNKTRQVVMNFIDNAIYYTPSGNVTVHLDQTGERVRLRVTDTGIGVPDEAKKKLFSKFYRADNAQSVRPDGTGLGLYLARRVVEDQGGTILFESTIGKGSMFGFELPLQSPKTVNEAPHG